MKVIEEIRIALSEGSDCVGGVVTATDGSVIRSEVKHGDAVSLLSSVQRLLLQLHNSVRSTWTIGLPAIASHDVVENGLRDKGVWIWSNEDIDRPQQPAKIVPQQSVKSMLAERESRYGRFASHAAIAQSLKEQMWVTDSWGKLTPAQRESLEMIQHKVARILNGDPSYADNWVDIAGYAQLVVDELGGTK